MTWTRPSATLATGPEEQTTLQRTIQVRAPLGTFPRASAQLKEGPADKPWFDGGWHNCRNGDGSGCYAVIDFTGALSSLDGSSQGRDADAERQARTSRSLRTRTKGTVAFSATWTSTRGRGGKTVARIERSCPTSPCAASLAFLRAGISCSTALRRQIGSGLTWVCPSFAQKSSADQTRQLDWYAVDSEAPEGDSPVWKCVMPAQVTTLAYVLLRSDFPTVDPPDDLADTTKVITLSTTSTRQITRTLVDPTTANIPTISASATAEPSSDSGGGGSTTVAVGAGVGAGVGALALLGIIMVMVCYKRRRRSQRGSYHSTPQDSPEAREVGSSPGGSWRATLSFFKGRDTPARDTATTGSLPWSYNAPHMGNEHMGTEDLEDPALFAPRSDRHFSDSASLPISAHTGPTLDSGVSRNATVTSRGRKRLRGPRPV